MPTPEDNQIGLEAVLEDTAFNRSLAKYNKNLVIATKTTEQTATAINKSLEPAVQKVGTSYSAAAKMVMKGVVSFILDAGAKILSTVATVALTVATVVLTVAVVALIAVAAIIAVAFVALAAVMTALVAPMGLFVAWMFLGENSAMQVASRVQELNFKAQALGQQMGLTGAQVNEAVKKIQALGVSASTANNIVLEFERNQLSLADATGVTAVAMDAAAISGKTVEETVAGIAKGVANLSEENLRSSGILIDSNAAYATYAATLGVLPKDLTEVDKQQALLNATIEYGTKIQGAYTASLMTGSAQLKAMSDVFVPNLKNAMGAPFQQGFYNITAGMNGIITAITGMVSEGGVLYPLLVQLGAVFSIITEPILGFGEALTNMSGTGGPIDNAVQGIMSFVENAFNWGVNLVTNFATGIINAASGALTSAMNYIGNILTSWLGPGSPPQILPDIDTWGTETISEWLHGMTQADFGVLKDIQGPLKQALAFSEQMGLLGKGEAADWYANISAGMLSAMQGNGDINQVFADMTAGAGEFGAEIVELTQLELAQAAASEEVTVAQKKMEDAAKSYMQAGEDVNKGLFEYNQMLRSGASKEALAAKLKEINANREKQKQSRKDLIAAADETDAAEARQKALLDQIDLQKQLIQMMMDLAKAREDANAPIPEPSTPPGGGGGGGTVPTPPVGGGGGLGFDPSGITSGIGDAVAAAAEEMKLKMAEAWQTIKDTVKAKWDEAVKEVLDAWGRLMKNPVFSRIWKALSDAWYGLKTMWEDVKNIWNHIIKGEWKLAWEDILKLFKDWWKGFKQVAKDWIEVIRYILHEKWEKIKEKATEIWEKIKKKIKEKFERIRDKIKDVSDNIRDRWETFWDKVHKKLTDIWDAIKKYVKDKIEDVRDKIKDVSDTIKEKWETFWDKVHTKVTEIWDAVKKYIGEKIDETALKIETVSDDIKLKWDTFWTNVHDKVTGIWDAIKLYIETKFNAIRDYLGNSADGTGVIGTIHTRWTSFWDDVKSRATEIWDGENGIKTKITTALDAIKGWIGNYADGTGFLGTVMTRWQTAWNDFKAKVIGIWDGDEGIKKKVETAVDWFKGLFTNAQETGMIDKISGWATDVYDKFKTLGGNIASGIRDGIKNNNLWGALTGLANKILDIIKKLLGISSPSKVMAKIGRQMMEGWELGIELNATLPKRATARAVMGVAATPMATIPIMAGNTNNYQPNITMHNNINNGMSAVQLEALIIRTVKRGMTK